MGSWATLRIGDKPFANWRYEIPEAAWLSFIFTDENKVIEALDPVPDSSPETHTFRYEATVQQAKDRLQALRMSRPDIDQAIAKGLGIAVEEVGDAALDFDGFDDKYPEPSSEEFEDDDQFLEAYTSWETRIKEHERLEAAVEKGGLGPLVLIHHLAAALDASDAQATVILDFDDDLGWGTEAELQALQLYGDEDGTMPVERRYLTLARVHFCNHQLNLVFVDLAIALEMSAKACVERLCDARDIPADVARLYRKMGPLDMAIFGVTVLAQTDLDSELVGQVELAYNKRNNVIHQGAKNFSMSEAATAIGAIEALVAILDAIEAPAGD